MIYRKPTVLISPYNSLNSLNLHPPTSSASCSGVSYDRRRTTERQYATIAEQKARGVGEQHQWPSPKHPHALPTPYQVLGVKHGTAYSKQHFYRLVKLYHPDRMSEAHIHSSVCHLPEQIRLERYRLIVTAHAILSDSGRRSMYDKFGAGWGDKPDHPTFGSGSANATSNSANGTASWTAWRSDNNPMYNATWEDWERWYQRNEEEPQGPRYLSNMAFVSVIFMCAALGGIGQATRAGTYSQTFLDQRNDFSDKTHEDLRRVKDKAKGTSRGERMERFMQGSDPDTFSDAGLRKIVLDPDVCESGNIEDGGGGHPQSR